MFLIPATFDLLSRLLHQIFTNRHYVSYLHV